MSYSLTHSLQDELSHVDLLRLYAAASVYVQPFRSEGFGLTILEAMAMGLRVIVTDAGPAREVCPRRFEGCLFVDAAPAACDIKPCGNCTLFGEPTTSQPMWAEPKVAMLQARLREAYESRGAAARLRPQLIAHAAARSWRGVGTQMLARIRALLQRKQAAAAARM